MCNLGNLFKAQGMLQDAQRCYVAVLKQKPGFSIAWSNLAGVLKDLGNA